MPKYELIDDNNNPVGFVVIRSETITTMQSVAGGGNAGVLSAVGPMAEAALFVVILGGSVAAIRVAGGDGLLAGAVGVAGGLVVTGIRAWRGGIPGQDKKAAASVVVRGEFKDDNGTLYFDEIRDKSVNFASLQRVCVALVNNNFEWMGRPTAMVKAQISRGQYDLIRAEFQRLNYFRDGEGNKVEITMRGRLFVHKVFEYDKRKK